jgi:hypothetical protein
MADSPNRVALQMLDQLFVKQAEFEQNLSLRSYLNEGGSIFPLVEKGAKGLVRDFNMSPEDAQVFLRRANGVASFIRRQFIEKTLYGDENSGSEPSSGLLSMVTGPNYRGLFAPNFDELCPEDALESVASPVAYLIELLRWIRDRIELSGNPAKMYLLHDRRTDLKQLSVDVNAVHKSVSSVDIIVSVLEKFIKAQTPTTDLEESLIQTRYPNGLPYYQHWVTLDAITHHYGLSVGNFAHMVDEGFPYFLQANGWDPDAGRALAHASRLGPYQRQLLTEPPVKRDEREDFYSINYGTGNLDLYQSLNVVSFFGVRTKLDTPAIEALLSVHSFVPVRSANVTYADTTPAVPERERSGSVYLNANKTPAVSITTDGASFLHRLTADPDTLDGLDHYDRMNRMIRLCNWLELPSHDVDALLTAAIKADVRGGAKVEDWRISDNVVHALGLFQSLRENYGCPASDFAVFIDGLLLYGRGEALSQFDQVFNSQGDYRQPFKLDNAKFPLLPAVGTIDLTVNQLCNGLGIDLQTYTILALAISQAHNLGDTLERSSTVVSSFYRLVKLPRLLGMTPIEGLVMLALLGGDSWVEGLAGEPRINQTTGSTPDVLSLIYALHSCAGWCRDRDLPVSWMLQHVSAPAPLNTVTALESQLIEQVRNLLPAALFTNAGLIMAGVPPVAGGNWLELFAGFIENNGLVVAYAVNESEYLALARQRFDIAVKDGLGDIDATLRLAIVEKMLTVLLQAREAQVSVVKECLAVYTSLDAEQAIQVLNWANSTVYYLLQQVLQRADLEAEASMRGRNEASDPLLTLLAEVRRRSGVVAKLGLSAGLLRDYLEYGHKAWLGQDDKYAFTVKTLYYLTALTRAFELSKQPAQKLLDYLRQVNALPNVSGDALRLAEQAASIKLAEFFGWSVQEVRECVNRIDTTLKVLKNLIQLDLLMRIRVLSTHTGMDALTIFLIGKLPEAVAKEIYAAAAEHALLSQSESRAPIVQLAGDLKQLVTYTCVPDKTEVVASKPDDKIIFTVTLMDSAGGPLSGVNVYWRASLGSVATRATEIDGVVRAEYIPGKVMGSEAPMFWIDLFDTQSAPTINLGSDVVTLTFPPQLMSPVPLNPVASGHEVALSATLKDKYSNLGKNKLVRWFARDAKGKRTPLVKIRPAQAFTNEDGLTQVFVSSTAKETVYISALSEASEIQANFESISFEGSAT